MNWLTTYLLAIGILVQGAGPVPSEPGSGEQQAVEWLLFETLNLGLTGPCYDVAFYQDNIIFLKPGEEALYMVPILRPDQSFSSPLFSNRDISCSPAALSFTSDFSRVYYTRPVMGNEQAYQERIFELSVEDNRVSELKQLSLSGNSSRELHPSISADGSLLVFSSDQFPSSGGLDLFVSRKTSVGWSTPRNLGEHINTSGHEWFPFLDKNNNLWFSSTGHSGYGGFDIYFCPFDGTQWGIPRNLGKDINGPQNELGFSLHPDKQLAVFSRDWTTEEKGDAIMLTLNERALADAGMDDPRADNIALYLQGMAEPAVEKAPVPEQEIPAEEAQIPVQENQEPAPRENNREPAANSDPNPVVFRVQIISSLYSNSFPVVFIDGEAFDTYEYFYLGSYRITVGEFSLLKDAAAFRLKCLESGFQQAFVAAFRGDERITDPSVFQQ